MDAERMARELCEAISNLLRTKRVDMPPHPSDCRWCPLILAALREARRQGREEMREEAATMLSDDTQNRWDWDDRMRSLGDMFAAAIRALPLDPKEEE